MSDSDFRPTATITEHEPWVRPVWWKHWLDVFFGLKVPQFYRTWKYRLTGIGTRGSNRRPC